MSTPTTWSLVVLCEIVFKSFKKICLKKYLLQENKLEYNKNTEGASS